MLPRCFWRPLHSRTSVAFDDEGRRPRAGPQRSAPLTMPRVPHPHQLFIFTHKRRTGGETFGGILSHCGRLRDAKSERLLMYFLKGGLRRFAVFKRCRATSKDRRPIMESARLKDGRLAMCYFVKREQSCVDLTRYVFSGDAGPLAQWSIVGWSLCLSRL